LLRRQDPQLADCYSVDVDHDRGREPPRGAAYKITLPDAIERTATRHLVDWREPVFEPDGERVRIRATRRSSQTADTTELVLVVAPGPDGGWRIVEESGVGWPEK
jgi:hypothetical protein